MVISVVSDLLKVVMLAAHAEALLCVGTAARFGLACAEDDVLPLVHTSVCKHQCWVILDYHRRTRHDGVSFRLEELLERVADFVSCHHFIFCFDFLTKSFAKVLCFAYFCK